MTRDPSDGSVKERSGRRAETDTGAHAAQIPTTALPPDPEDQTELSRLQRSRKWLQDYRTNPEKVTRESGEQGT